MQKPQVRERTAEAKGPEDIVHDVIIRRINI